MYVIITLIVTTIQIIWGIFMLNSNDSNERHLPDYEKLFNDTASNKNSSTKILFSLWVENYKELIVSSVLYVIKNAAVWVIPVIIANVINIVTNPKVHNLNEMWINAIIGIVILLLNIPSHVLYVKVTSKALRNISAGIRNSLIRKLQQLSITYYKEMESGKLQSKFLRDTEAIEFLNNQIINSLIPAAINILVTLVITLQKNVIVTLFYFIIIPLILLVRKVFGKKMRTNNQQFRHEVEMLSAKMSNMINMIPITRAHGLEDEEINKLEENINRLKFKGMQLDKTTAYFGSINWVIINILSNSCVFFTAFLALHGKMQVGDILMFQSFFGIIMGQAQAIINLYPEFAKGIESINSVSEIMFSNDIEDNRNKIKLRYVHGTLQFEHVYYQYPHEKDYVIEDFNLQVEPGECIAFVGSSGSGKSTIMNMIIGFLKPSKGMLKLDGKDINILNLKDYRKFIAVVPQNSILFAGTIKENITYGLKNVDEKKFEEVLELANINEFVDKLPNGVNTVVGELGNKLSGGQKQRISIARALIRDPQIIILDEATSALDNISEYHVQKAIASLIKGRTTFIVAHRLSTIRDANRIVVMDEGKIIETGTYDELMNLKGEFYKLKELSEMKSMA